MKREFKNLTLFKRWTLENFPFIEADFDAITNYQLMCKIIEYINKMGDQFNDIVNNQEYINEWFNNLDVQDEVDKKIDEMVESGQLQEIIADYLNSKAIFGFDNVQSMKNSTNLIEGSYAKTLGYYSIKDNGSSLYKIRKITNDDVVDDMFIIALNDDELIAELIYNDKLNVMQVGIRSNTNTDVKDKIQNALNKIKNIEIILNDGTYNISENLTLNNNILIGKNTTIKCLNTYTSNNMLILSNNIKLKGIKFDGNNKIYSIIGTETTNDEYIENCEFTGCKTTLTNIFPLNACVYLTGKNVIVNETIVHDNEGHGMQCYALENNSNIIVKNSKFYNNGYEENYQSCGLCEYGETIGSRYNVAQFINCEAYNNGASGIACHSVYNIETDNCYCHNNKEHGIVLMDGYNGKITNCTLIDNAFYGVRVQGDYNSGVGHYDNFIITNNTITGCGGIWISFNVNKGIITNNVIKLNGTTKYGILLGDVSYPSALIHNVIIKNNIIKDFPFKTALNTSVLYGKDVKIEENLIDNQYRLGATFNTSYQGYIVANNEKYGTSNNIAVNPTDFSQSSWSTTGTKDGNTITPASGIILWQDITLTNVNPKFVALSMNFQEYNHPVSLGLRFRNASSSIITFTLPESSTAINEVGWNITPQDTSIGVVYDLTRYTFNDDVKIVEVFIKTASNNTAPITINSVYCALSNELPIIPV